MAREEGGGGGGWGVGWGRMIYGFCYGLACWRERAECCETSGVGVCDGLERANYFVGGLCLLGVGY